MDRIPSLRSERVGRDEFFIFSEDIGPAIQHALSENMDENAIKLIRATQLVRN